MKMKRRQDEILIQKSGSSLPRVYLSRVDWLVLTREGERVASSEEKKA